MSGGRHTRRFDLRRGPARVAMTLALLVGAVDLAVIGSRVSEGAAEAVEAGREQHVLRAAAPLPPVLAVTTTTAPPPPPPIQEENPDSPVLYRHYAPPEPEVVLGTLEIPKIGLSQTLFHGIAISTIDKGPSHWPGTALPGHIGNTVIAGHRVTKTRPFRHMDQLGPGDQAFITTSDGTFVYEWAEQLIVTPKQTEILDQGPGYTATFFACHPPGSARYRIVTRWNLVSGPATGAPPA